MRVARRNAILLTAIALILCILQAGVWVHSTAHDHSETQKINTETQDPPTEIPGLAAFCLFVVAGAMAALPHPPFSD